MSLFPLLLLVFGLCRPVAGETYDYVCSCPPFWVNLTEPCRLTIMAADLPTNVNISTTYGDRQVSLQPGQTAFEQLDGRLSVWREVEDKAIVVTSDAPIHLSLDRMDTYNSEPRFIDSTQMLATKAYDQELYEYFVISYHNPVYTCGVADTAMFYTIASSNNNMQVDVYNKSVLVKSVTLNTRQTYTYGLPSVIGEDITGLRIVTSKPASVISGNMCTFNPDGAVASVFTSVQPVAFDKYVAPVLGNSRDTGYTLRAIAVNNNSLITVNNVSYVINQGEFINEELDGRTEPSFIECDSMCTAYLMTKVDSGIYDIGLSFISIIPLSKYYSSVFFSTLEYSVPHFVSIVAEGQGPYTDITLNGTALSDKPWKVMQDFSYVWFEVSFGSYRVESGTGRKMAVYVYSHSGYFSGGYAHSVWPADYGVEAGSTTVMTTTTVSPPARPLPQYRVTTNGTAVTPDASAISPLCAATYVSNMADSANKMAAVHVNGRIAAGALCAGSPDLTVTTTSSQMTFDAHRALTTVHYQLDVQLHHEYRAVAACAADIAAFVTQHANWDQPILPGDAGASCPNLLFDPEEFHHRGNSWRCGVNLQGDDAVAETDNDLFYYHKVYDVLRTQDGSTLSPECVDRYTDAWQEQAAAMLADVRAALEAPGDEGLCGEPPAAADTVTYTSSFASLGDSSVVLAQFLHKPAAGATFSEFHSCVGAVIDFTRLRANWGNPFLPVPGGCPRLDYDADNLTLDDDQDWSCL